MQIYMVLDKFGYGTVLKGLYTNEEDAKKVRERLGRNHLKYASKRLAEGEQNYKNVVKSFEMQGREPPRRWYWLDYTPEEFVENDIIVMVSLEPDEPLDYILYME